MSDFTSDFWSWWIITIVVGGIVFCIWLLLANRKSTLPAGGTAEATGHVWDEDLEELNNPLPRWWIIKFYITIVFGIAYFALYPGLGTFEGILGWTEKGQYEAEIAAADNKYGPLYDKYMNLAIPAVAADEDAMKMGERLYVNYCAVCHGSDARGATGFPNLRDDDWLYGGDAATIKATLVNGRQAVMPAWGSVIGDEGIADVTQYVLSLNGRTLVTVTERDVPEGLEAREQAERLWSRMNDDQA